jgi:hypothetical protein
MLVYAASQLGPGLSIVIGLFGLSGIVFTALRFRRDDTTAVVTQQTQITTEMKTLADEQRLALERVRDERDALKAEVARLTGQIEVLREDLREARTQNVSRIERRGSA